jgi:hypothetical protein
VILPAKPNPIKTMPISVFFILLLLIILLLIHNCVLQTENESLRQDRDAYGTNVIRRDDKLMFITNIVRCLVSELDISNKKGNYIFYAFEIKRRIKPLCHVLGVPCNIETDTESQEKPVDLPEEPVEGEALDAGGEALDAGI